MACKYIHTRMLTLHIHTHPWCMLTLTKLKLLKEKKIHYAEMRRTETHAANFEDLQTMAL